MTTPITTIEVGNAPAGHQREGNGAGKDPDGVAQEAGDQKDGRGEPPGTYSEAGLEPGVRRLLIAPEVSRQEPDGHADASDQIAEGELEEGEVAARADAGHRDHGERRGFGGDDGEENGPGGQVSRAEEVVGGAPLAAGYPEPEAQGEDEVQDDDDEVGGVQSR